MTGVEMTEVELTGVELTGVELVKGWGMIREGLGRIWEGLEKG